MNTIKLHNKTDLSANDFSKLVENFPIHELLSEALIWLLPQLTPGFKHHVLELDEFVHVHVLGLWREYFLVYEIT